MPEVTQCPKCQRKLNVPEAHLGQMVQCPVCGESFTATVLSVQRPPPVREEREPRGEERPPSRGRDYDEPGPPYREGDDDDDRGRRYPPGRRGYGRDPYGEVAPHRGGVILALGLTGMLLCCVPFAGWILGGIALSMAGTDLPRMDRGTMDRDGRGLTVGGRVCGIIAVIGNSILALILCSGVLNDM